MNFSHESVKEQGSPKRVLMLAHGFPPGSQNVLRSLKFAKYLPEFGWAPIVLTPLQPSSKKQEYYQIPKGTRVVRTGRFATPSMRVMTFKNLKSPRKSAQNLTDGMASAYDDSGGNLPRPSSLEDIIREILLWGDTPDDHVGWLPQALRHGRRLIRTHRIEAIHASGPPFSTILAGALLSSMTDIPLVADFRDTWTLDINDPFGTIGGHFRSRNGRCRMRVLEGLERWCLLQSEAVLFTSRTTQELYERRYPFIKGCSRLIYNGADLCDLNPNAKPPSQPTITHSGTIHPYQWPQFKRFLSAFSKALRDNELPPNTQLLLAGVSWGVEDDIKKAIEELEIQDQVKLLGFLPHQEAVSWMQSSHLLVMFVADNPYIRLMKISEYVATGRHMLALAPLNSETANEVQRYGGAVIDETVMPEYSGLLADALVKAISDTQHQSEIKRSPIEHPHPLNRRTNAQQLAETLNSLVGKNSKD